MVHGADTSIIASNIEAQNLLGLVENKMVGKTAIDPHWKFINTRGKNLPPEMYPVNQVLTHRRPLRDYTLGICHPGRDEIMWVLVNAKPAFNDKGEIEHIIVTFMDITERINAEQKLNYSKLQLDAICNNIDSSIYIACMASYEILFMNDHMKKLFGNDLTGEICWKAFHENMDGPCEFCTNNKLTDAVGNPTEPYVWESYNQVSGRWYELHDLAIPWSDGRLVRMEIATDITDKIEAAEALEQQKKDYPLRLKLQTLGSGIGTLKQMKSTLVKITIKWPDMNRMNFHTVMKAGKKEFTQTISIGLKKRLNPI